MSENNVYRVGLYSGHHTSVLTLACALCKVSEEVSREALARGQGQEYVNAHPAVRLLVAQMLWLAYGISLDNEDYRAAFLACSEWRDREVERLMVDGASESPSGSLG